LAAAARFAPKTFSPPDIFGNEQLISSMPNAAAPGVIFQA
jgi:hypothetical protein